MSPVNLEMLQREVGEAVAGRPGGAVSLAVGMAQIFGSLPGMRGLLDYWYHFAIMFEALFILTTIDAGTRVGRFLVQEFGGRVWPQFGNAGWLPGRSSRPRWLSSRGPTSSDRQHQHHLADVRHRQPVARGVALAVGTTVIIMPAVRGMPGLR